MIDLLKRISLFYAHVIWFIIFGFCCITRSDTMWK